MESADSSTGPGYRRNTVQNNIRENVALGEYGFVRRIVHFANYSTSWASSELSRQEAVRYARRVCWLTA